MANYQNNNPFESEVYSAPTIAGSIKAMLEGAICHTYSLMLWEIDRLRDFAAENFVKANEEFAQNALEKMVDDEKRHIFEVVPDDEMKDPIEDLLQKILNELKEAQEKFLTSTRNVTLKFSRGITNIKGYAELGLTESKLRMMLLDLQAGVDRSFYFGYQPSAEASQRAAAYLPSAPPIKYMDYDYRVPSAPPEELHATPVDSSDAVEATDVRVLTQEEVASMNLRRALHNAGVGVNDPNALELTLRLKVAQAGQLQAHEGLGRDLHAIDQRIMSCPEVFSSMQQHGYKTPTPKPPYSGGKKRDE
ncbi:MAG: hypothetical protein KBD83_03115 [Gammaproteobacteria bacterium]|nr:hypothetical protein [Gammaproteobacteria bacterium]